jgi:hypothetical protein
VLQGAGELSGAILPNWISGYGFVFPAERNLDRARQLRSEVRQAPLWTLGYDGNDPLARVIAERIALNAGDAGLRLQATTSASADIRLMRIPLASLNPRIGLVAAAAATSLPAPKFSGNSIESLYRAESELLQTQRVIPLFQLPASYALGATVRNWNQDRDGGQHLEKIWLGSKP